jgi:hypothetical protein
MRIQPTFTAKRHGEYSILICRETAERYCIGTDERGFHVAYREGALIARRVTRDGALQAIESDARWSIRDLLHNSIEIVHKSN